MTYHGPYPPAEPRRAKLKAYLATQTVRPPLSELGILLGVSHSTVQQDLEQLAADGVIVPPSGGRHHHVAGQVPCSIIPSLQRGQYGWMVTTRRNPAHPERPVVRHWCADVDEAFAILRALRAGQSVEDAIHELMR